jgi:hypothetical protein
MFTLHKGESFKGIATGSLYYRMYGTHAGRTVETTLASGTITTSSSIIQDVIEPVVVNYVRLINASATPVTVRLYIGNVPISSKIEIPADGAASFNGEVVSIYDKKGAPITGIVIEGGGNGGAVQSVNGQTGEVMLSTENIPESINPEVPNQYFTSERAQDALSDTVTNLQDQIDDKLSLEDASLTEWDLAYSWGNHATRGYVTRVVSDLDNYYTKTQGDARYLQSFTESDPTVPIHVKGISTSDIDYWNEAYSWGDHSQAGYALNTSLSDYYTKVQSDERYLQSYTETDPTVPSHVKSISTTNISNWNSAYGWGNHAVQGYALASDYYTKTQSDGRYLQSFTETDPVFTASPASGITSTKISNWDTAYSWGNHSTAGYITGSGTIGSIPKFSSTGAIQNSIISDNGTNIILTGYSVDGGVLYTNSVGTVAQSSGLKWNDSVKTVDITGLGFRVFNSGNGYYFYNGVGGGGNFGIFDINAGADRFILYANGNFAFGANAYSNPSLQHTSAGNTFLSKLSSGSPSPITSGEIKMVVADSQGMLATRDIPTSGGGGGSLPGAAYNVIYKDASNNGAGSASFKYYDPGAIVLDGGGAKSSLQLYGVNGVGYTIQGGGASLVFGTTGVANTLTLDYYGNLYPMTANQDFGTMSDRWKMGYFNNVLLNTLSGTGNRMVIADSTGLLSTQAIPSGGGSGTVTTLTASNATGQTWTITNPSTTPNIALALTKAAVGLANVDNTSDSTKNSATATLTNKRVTSRSTLLAGTTFSLNSNSFDLIIIQPSGSSTITYTGTPTQGQLLYVRISGTSSNIVLSWNSAFTGRAYPLPTLVSPSVNPINLVFTWDAELNKWVLILSDQTGLTVAKNISIRQVTANTTLVTTDGTIEANANSTPLTITLPSTTGIPGLEIQIIKTDSTANAVTVVTGGTTINGSTNYVLSTQYKRVTVKVNSAANAWLIVENN